LGTHELSHIARPAKPFFILETRGPQETMRHVAALEPSPQGGRVQSHGTHDSTRALLGREARPRTIRHVTAPEPS
jgi:hypothetical protein